MAFKKTYEELNMLLPFSPDIKVQQSQREKMVIMSFLAGLPSEFEFAKSQILSGSEISSLQDAFSRVLRTESPSPHVLPLSGALVSRNNNYSCGRSINQNRNKGVGSQKFEPRTFDSSGIESLKSSSSVSVIVDSGKSNACLISSSSKWVINSGATDHIIGPYDEEGYW
ncbi:hypothetical protein POM88_025576 [Heracleum sosnowskyi]|uniref:Uncharacterized protein n=1 Tax=Heracleum sosnowskyi TaxID=360622 RepID=A0AAD8I477_9APIA|nr:hypothetical protein POM88_025576 [Heracleum sosnowskyi]